MRWLASGTVDEVVGKIDLPENPDSMLDVGGSHGLYTVAFCEKYDGLNGTVLDWEIGLKETEKTLEENPAMADRIDLVERDFEKEELPGGYDFAFLGNIIHGVSPEGNRELFRKLAEATTERGMVAIVDQFAGIKGSKFARAVAGLAGLNLFLFAGGRAYPFETVKKWLADAGFTKTELKKLKQPGFSLAISQKE
jgi:cyclopropane fatty-acyl-phospholipid synthase-like methyltransferase